MVDPISLVSAIQATTQLVEQAFRILKRLRTAYERQKDVVEVLNRHEIELSGVKTIIGIIEDEEGLQTPSIATELGRLQAVQTRLAKLLHDLDPKGRGKISQYTRQLIHGSEDERKLCAIMNDLAQVKSTLLVCIEVANVREMGNRFEANAEAIQRIDEILREHIENCEGLQIARLLKGRRPSNDGYVSLTQAELRSLENEASKSECSEDKTLVDESGVTSPSGSFTTERTLIINAARHKSVQINGPTELASKPILGHALAEMAEKLPSDWREVQDELPDSYKWDVEFTTTCLEGAAKNGCWTCTPMLDGKPEQIPLTIAQAPVVIPVEYRWPPVGGVNPPPDPRALSLINPWTELSVDVIRDLFLTFEGALGFYVLISGLLQVIVPNTFQTAWASSHLPHSFGGLRVCYIANTIEPTTLQSNVTVAHPTSATPQTPNVQFTHLSRQSRPAQSLQINDLIEARVSSMSQAKFKGRIGLKVAKNNQLDPPYLIMSTHVITEAILSKSFFGLTRDPIKRLQDDWNKHAEIWVGNSKIGIIKKSFDQDAEHYPSGFNHDITLIQPEKDREASIADIKTPINNLGWLSRGAWSSLRQRSAAVKILGPTGPDKDAKSIQCHTHSEATIVGEGVFLNQTAAAGKKALESHDKWFWRKFVSRAMLYRVNPDFSTPNGYSGVALWADGEREDRSQGPGIVGFQSFVQRSGHTQNFNVPEGPHLEQRLRQGLVAFYGAFQVPDELRQEYKIL